MNTGRFRLVYNRRLGMPVPVAEIASAQGKDAGGRARRSPRLKPLALLLGIVLASPPALANPTGPTVVSGSASFNQSGNTLTITNTANSIINWGSFSIGRDELTRFNQPSSASRVLNRVIGQDPSQILGQLQSNGRVFLINPNGVLFGQGAKIDVAGLVASSLNLGNADFLAGRMRFVGAGGEGAVSNAGGIATPAGGQVILIAPSVENSGIITTPQGEVILAAGHSVELADSLNPALRVQVTAPDGQAINLGTVLAESGRVGVVAGLVSQSGTINAGSAVSVGGKIYLRATNVLQSGALGADAGTGNGGSVTVAADRIIQTESARVSANGGGGGSGGEIVVQAGSGGDGRLFSSGTFSATGAKGGDIQLLGNQVVLLGAHADAGGDSGGGRILVGGDRHGGNPEVANASQTAVNFSTRLSADAGNTGNGGEVVVWSEQRTDFYGLISARGGSRSGDGGFVEVSGKQNFYFGGHVDAGAGHGKPGTLLMDPANITIDGQASSYGVVSLVDPNPDAGNFGSNIIVLGSGNILVTDPQDSLGALNAGAAYLYNGGSGGLIAALVGSHAGDQVGSGGINTFGSGNYLVQSPLWNGGAGAVTWGSGTLGVAGIVAAANSLVGTHANDAVGNGGLYALDNSHYLILSPDWNSGAGALTWMSAGTGVAGSVAATNSLLGSSAGDAIGSAGIYSFGTGHFLVQSPHWNNDAGALTWLSATAAVTGVVSQANSLVGSLPGDQIGSDGIHDFGNGNYLVLSPNWNGGFGAVTGGNEATAVTGVVSATNSLVGSHAGDAIGQAASFQEIAGSGGNFLMLNPQWNGNAGAVTWCSNQGQCGLGVVSNGNSLLGSTPGDRVGSGYFEFGNGHYVLISQDWSSSNPAAPAAQAGAVTWGDGASAITGFVSAANSLVGSHDQDRIGSDGIRDFGNGNFLVLSSNWNGGFGAVTWGSDATGLAGVVSAANSLVGSHVGDAIGQAASFQEIAGSGGNVLMLNPQWNGDTGAVTWCSNQGQCGVGVVSDSNSLVGSTPGDRVGSGYFEFGNGNYLLNSPDWTYISPVAPPAAQAGAVTWGDGTATIQGFVSAANSLVGSHAGDQIGSGSVQTLSSGNALVLNPQWNGNMGAATWIDATAGVSGVVSATNSLLGTTPGDQVGSDGIRDFGNGNFLVLSSNWNGGFGAVTWGSDATGLAGVVSAANSLVGSHVGDAIGQAGSFQVIAGSGGNVLMLNPQWNNATGAVTWCDNQGICGGGTGVVSNGNSLVGSTAGDQVGSGYFEFGNGNYLLNSPEWTKPNFASPPVANVGALTWGDGTATINGFVSASNSLVGSHTGDRIGSGSIHALTSGSVLVLNPQWNGNQGAATWMDGGTAVLGVVSAANSLVGSLAGDRIGSDGIRDFGNGNFLVLSSNWNGGFGAVTRGSDATGLVGVVAAANSLVGSHAGDVIGQAGSFQAIAGSGGNFLMLNPQWNGNAGAVTWCSNQGQCGTGIVSDSNSLVGTSAGDRVGSGYSEFGNGHYLLNSPDWTYVDPVTHVAAANAGALTWGNGAATIQGFVSETNSLVGSHAGDRIGSGSIQSLSSGNLLLLNPQWNGNQGAVTWNDGITAVTGVVSTVNSLVGSHAGDRIGSDGIRDFGNGNFLVLSSNWNGGFGAVTRGSDATGVAGVVSAANSLVGSHAGDAIGQAGSFQDIAGSGGNTLMLNPQWNNATGAVTWCSNQGQCGLGVVSNSNSLVGSTAGDRVGSGYSESGNGHFVLTSPDWTYVDPVTHAASTHAGAATWGDGAATIHGVVSAANALVGSHAGDAVGSGGITWLSDGNYVVTSPGWNGGIGAVTWGDGTVGVAGVVTGQNSLTNVARHGGQTADSIAIQDLFDGRFLVSGMVITGVGTGVKALQIQIYSPNNTLMPPTLSPFSSFGDTPTLNWLLTPQQITDLTDLGTAVVLQANNDIVVNSAVVTHAAGPGGDLTLQAGRSIEVNADIVTGNGNLTLIANESQANGVVDGQRQAGAAHIWIQNGAQLDAGGGTATLTLRDSSDKTHNDAGEIGIWNGAVVSAANIAATAEAGTITMVDAHGVTGAFAVGAAGGLITLTSAGAMEAYVNPGSNGLVSFNGSGNLHQTTGDLVLSHYTLSPPAGPATLGLIVENGDILVDANIALPNTALTLTTPWTGSYTHATRFSGSPVITAASLRFASEAILVDNGVVTVHAPLTGATSPLGPQRLTLSNGGRLTLAGTAALNDVVIGNAILDLNAATTFNGGVALQGGGTLNLPAGMASLGDHIALSGGTLNNPGVLTLGNVTWSAGAVVGTGSLIVPTGKTLSKSTAGTVDIQQALDNQGTVAVQAGTLQLSAGGSHGGAFSASNGATLALTGGSHTLAAGASLDINNATLDSNGALQIAGSATLNHATITGAGTVTIAGGGSLSLTDSNVTAGVVNSGSVVLPAGTTTFAGGFTQAAGGLTLGSSGGAGANLTVGAPGLQLDGGLLGGSGTITGDVAVTAATLAPGFSPGTLNIVGNLNLAPNSVTSIQLWGRAPGSFDVINISGVANLAGALQIGTGNGFVPAPGDSLTFMTFAGGSTGNFNSVALPGNMALQSNLNSLAVNWSGLLPRDNAIMVFADTSPNLAIVNLTTPSRYDALLLTGYRPLSLTGGALGDRSGGSIRPGLLVLDALLRRADAGSPRAPLDAADMSRIDSLIGRLIADSFTDDHAYETCLVCR